MKIALVKGGLSQEAEVSRNTAKAFEKALVQLKLNYVVIEAGDDLPSQLTEAQPDVVLIALHGKYGEDGTVQGICEYLKIPYTGSGVLSSALAMDKLKAKQVLSFNGIPTPSFDVYNSLFSGPLDNFVSPVKAPCVVKPAREGSSVGISIVKNQADFKPALELALKSDENVLIESFVDGIEVTVPILSNKALTPIEIKPKDGFYDYANKYTAGKTEYFLPPRLPEEKIVEVQGLAEKCFKLLNMRHYGRIDFMVSGKGEIFFIEANSLPGCTETSLLPQSAKHDGITFGSLVRSLIDNARLDYEGVV